MIEQKLLQNIGNLVVRDIEARYPDLSIRFLAVKDSLMKMAITPKGDKSGRTTRLFDLKPVNDVDPTAIKLISENLASQMIQAVQEYNRMWNRA